MTVRAAAAHCSSYPLEGVPRARQPNVRREALYTCLGLILTVAGSVMVARELHPWIRARLTAGAWIQLAADIALLGIVSYLILTTVLYFACRLAYLRHLAVHRPSCREDLEAIYHQRVPLIAILVPSYKEEERVVRQTLVSAALMEYPDRDIVLLIDDPPDPRDSKATEALARMHRLPLELQELFETQARRYAAALAGFERRRARGAIHPSRESDRVAQLYREVAAWMQRHADLYEVRDHADRLFVQRILREPARSHRERARTVEGRGRQGALCAEELLHEYRRLAALFAARFASFERKRFQNLSHVPNKAMNLNSYLGLMGGSFREVTRPDGLHLEPCPAELAPLRVPKPDYVITLDADSMVVFDYAMRLVHTMEQPAGRRFAVVQTPYTAVPGSPSLLERSAAAQTDVQWMIGQGATLFGATFWVGASAVLRRQALDEICEVAYERGHPVKKYIRDWTLVEDSESSVDLVAAGWTLYNYLDRLCYSATPPDFGSLVVQRRRWANGGLLILPKLIRNVLGTPGRFRKLPEMVLRAQYLSSTAGANLAVLSLLLIPFDREMSSFWLMLTPVPYFLLYGRDLVFSSYGWRDLPRVYALNLLLIPVNLGGVAKSLQQWWTGRQSPFTRTPRMEGRTAAPALYILATWGIISYCVVEAFIDLLEGKHAHGVFAAVNGMVFIYAMFRFVGILHAVDDMRANVRSRIASMWAKWGAVWGETTPAPFATTEAIDEMR